MKDNAIGRVRQGVAGFVIVWLSVLSPAIAWAEGSVDADGNPTGVTEPTGPQEPTGAQGPTGSSCSGVGCPVSAEDYAAWEAQVSDSGMQGINTNTGESSSSAVTANTDSSTSTSLTNDVTDTTTASLTGTTGGNDQSSNTSAAGINTGSAGIGVTSLKNDNTAVIGGSAGLDVSGYNGDYTGDYTVGFGSSAANLSNGGSYQAINDTTGANSTNTVDMNTHVEEINEVQNDGKILNDLVLKAITGQNTADNNTSNTAITTGPADIAATLVNLLNTTVINGSLMVSVADIFGDLMGNIVLPDLTAMAAAFFPSGVPTIVAGNENTGSDSTNAIDVDLSQTETTDITNDANITSTLNAEAITGQNGATGNTRGGNIVTGDASASLANLTVANTTVEGGNWGLVIVNALNRWLGFLVGDNGEVRALSQDETIEAINRNTGSDSDNTIAITDERERTTTVANDAEIVNDITARAITGQNTADNNTGKVDITTGDANIVATAVNIANTTVKDASLFIAVVNIFGDWFGDLLYGGSPLLATASTSPQATIEASNQTTGSGSENTIDVGVDRSKETTIDNDATINTNLNATIDTGTNKTNKNTLGGSIETGNGTLAMHSRALANLTGIALDPAIGLSISGLNDTTGFDSKNTINAELNDERIISIDNFADIDTLFVSFVNTGNNESSQNTIGGNIDTGNIDATVGIENLVNRVIFALTNGLGFAAGNQLLIDADFLNRLTGALSENSNAADANYNFLADINNDALIDNILDLLFNTGGNTANDNTRGAAITTGRICFDGTVQNNANQNTLGLAASQGVNADNQAAVNNAAGIQATTGNNQTNNNTSSGQAAGDHDGCPIAQAPVPTPPAQPSPTPGPAGGGQPSGPSGGGQGGGEAVAAVGGPGAEAAPAVAGVTRRPAITGPHALLRRFPVAGGETIAAWLPARRTLAWPLFLMVSGGLLAAAFSIDRQSLKSRRAKLEPVGI